MYKGIIKIPYIKKDKSSLKRFITTEIITLKQRI